MARLGRTPTSYLLGLEQRAGASPAPAALRGRPGRPGIFRAPSLLSIPRVSPSSLPILNPDGLYGGLNAPTGMPAPLAGLPVGSSPDATAGGAGGPLVDTSQGSVAGIPIGMMSAGNGNAAGATDGLPAPPSLQVPTLLAAPRQGLAVRAASALADTPESAPIPFESAGSALGRGLLSGAARGFAGSTLSDYQNAANAVSATNKQRQSDADAANALALESWKQRLKIATDSAGDWKVTPDLVKRMGFDPGKPTIDPKLALTAIEKNAAMSDARTQHPLVPVSGEIAQNLGVEDGTKMPTAVVQTEQQRLETIRHDKAMEQQARLTYNQKLAGGDPDRFAVLVRTDDLTGQQYVDMTNVQPKDMIPAMQWAKDHSVGALNKIQTGKLESINGTLAAIDRMEAQAGSFLSKAKPSNLLSRAGTAGSNTIQDWLGTNPLINAWGTWRIEAIKQLVALAGGQGSGLRVNQAEILQATQNDIPKVTDALDVAKQKMDNIRALMAISRNAIMNGQLVPITIERTKDGVFIFHAGKPEQAPFLGGPGATPTGKRSADDFLPKGGK